MRASLPFSAERSWSPIHGLGLRIRPIQQSDLPEYVRFLRGLSLETVYRRMLGAGFAHPTQAWLERQTHVDPARELALVASLVLDTDIIVGVGRIALARQTEGELALVVADAWQRRGIGARLLDALIDDARTRGVGLLVGDVLAENRPMLALASRSGFRIAPHPDGGALRRIDRDLRTDAPPPTGPASP